MFPGPWLAAVVTEDEKRWVSHSKENLLPRMARRAFTTCQCSQPSCSLSVSVEQSLLGATREQLSSLILVAAISNFIDVLYLGFHTMMNYHVKPETFKQRCVIRLWLLAVNINKKAKYLNINGILVTEKVLLNWELSCILPGAGFLHFLLNAARGAAGSASCTERRRLVVDQPSKSDLDIWRVELWLLITPLLSFN